MVFYAPFNNISAIKYRSVLLVEEATVSVKKYRLEEISDKLYHIMLYRVEWYYLMKFRTFSIILHPGQSWS
jgi:hypothetical protein